MPITPETTAEKNEALACVLKSNLAVYSALCTTARELKITPKHTTLITEHNKGNL